MVVVVSLNAPRGGDEGGAGLSESIADRVKAATTVSLIR